MPHRLRLRLAFDHTLCRAVVWVLVRAVLGWYRWRARRRLGRRRWRRHVERRTAEARPRPVLRRTRLANVPSLG